MKDYCMMAKTMINSSLYILCTIAEGKRLKKIVLSYLFVLQLRRDYSLAVPLLIAGRGSYGTATTAK